ncbi:14698_t:CDS:1, partial [Acaulospora colombiana]
ERDKCLLNCIVNPVELLLVKLSTWASSFLVIFKQRKKESTLS